MRKWEGNLISMAAARSAAVAKRVILRKGGTVVKVAERVSLVVGDDEGDESMGEIEREKTRRDI